MNNGRSDHGPSRKVEHIHALLRAASQVETGRELPDSNRTAAESAAALGFDVAQIGKSIIFRAVTDDRPVLVVASGAIIPA